MMQELMCFAHVAHQHMRVSLCTYSEQFGHNMFIDGEDGDLQYGHDEELNRAGFTQNSSKGDQDRSCAEVCVDHSEGQERKQVSKKIQIIGQ